MKKLFILTILLVSSSVNSSLKNEERFEDWFSRCEPASKGEVCYIEQNIVRGKEDKQRMLGVQFGYYQKKVIGNFILPLGVLLQPGVGIVVDGFQFSKRVPFTYCENSGCSASFSLDKKMVGLLKKGKKLSITAKSINGKVFAIPVSLNGFTKAFNALIAE